MKHSSIRELYDYWNARRGRRCAPARNDIDPGDIRSALADTFIVTLDQSAGHPFRIAGTRVCALFGRDLKQQAFLDLWSSGSRTMMCDLLGIVARESIGLLAGITGTGDAGDIDLELLALPLVHDGRSDARVLGALAPGCAPAWIGASAIDQLALGTFRYVGPAVLSKAAPPPLPPNGRFALGTFRYVGPAVLSKAAPPPLPPNGRWRRGLRVYDGGHARDKNGMLSTG